MVSMCPKGGLMSGESSDTKQKTFRGSNVVVRDAYEDAKKLGVGSPPQFGDDPDKVADYVLGSAKGSWDDSSDIEDSPSISDGRSVERNDAPSMADEYKKNAQLYADGKGIVLTVTGSRTFDNAKDLESAIKQIESETGKKVVMIQQGGAKGADKIAAQYAYDHGISSRQFDANWGSDGMGAGVKRNSTMVKSLMENKYGNNEKITLAAFDGKVTNGTADMLKKSILSGQNTKYIGINKTQYKDFVLNKLSKYAGKTAEGMPLKGAERLARTKDVGEFVREDDE
jgi:hypothetical protein